MGGILYTVFGATFSCVFMFFVSAGVFWFLDKTLPPEARQNQGHYLKEKGR